MDMLGYSYILGLDIAIGEGGSISDSDIPRGRLSFPDHADAEIFVDELESSIESHTPTASDDMCLAEGRYGLGPRDAGREHGQCGSDVAGLMVFNCLDTPSSDGLGLIKGSWAERLLLVPYLDNLWLEFNRQASPYSPPVHLSVLYHPR